MVLTHGSCLIFFGSHELPGFEQPSQSLLLGHWIPDVGRELHKASIGVST